jgi:hypothetical protein
MSFLLSLIFSLQQHRRARRWNRFCSEAGQGGRRGEVGKTMYTHARKCKNDKRKKKN